jgi:hypothetical protein
MPMDLELLPIPKQLKKDEKKPGKEVEFNISFM